MRRSREMWLLSAASAGLLMGLAACNGSSSGDASPTSDNSTSQPTRAATGSSDPSSQPPTQEPSTTTGWTLTYQKTYNGKPSHITLVLADPTHYAIYLGGRPTFARDGDAGTSCASRCHPTGIGLIETIGITYTDPLSPKAFPVLAEPRRQVATKVVAGVGATCYAGSGASGDASLCVASHNGFLVSADTGSEHWVLLRATKGVDLNRLNFAQ